MRVKDHIGKITWSFLDKGIMVAFGFFALYQLKFLSPEEFSKYISLIFLNNWIFIIADGLALQGLIQFGGKEENKSKVNLMALILLILVGIGASIVFYLLKSPIAVIFDQPVYSDTLSYLPILALFTIPRNYIVKMLYRELKFFQIFTVNLLFFGTQVVTTIYFIINEGFLDFNKMYQIYLSGLLISSIISMIYTFSYLKFSRRGATSYKEFLSFGFKVSLSSILHSTPRLLDIYIINAFFGLGTGGVYGAAKSLFKMFDEASSAAHGLIYPSAVKLISNNDINGLRSIVSKAVSFMLLAFLIITIVLNFGMTEFIIDLFGLTEKYSEANSFFNLMIFASIFLPFLLIDPIINALGKPEEVLKFVFISVIVFLIIILSVSFTKQKELLPIALIAYNLSLGLLSYNYIKKMIGFPISDLFRALRDGKNFLSELRSK